MAVIKDFKRVANDLKNFLNSVRPNVDTYPGTYTRDVVIDAPSAERAALSAPRAGGKVRATPVARRLAKEHNLDLTEIVAKYEIAGAVKEEHVRLFLDA